MPVPSVQQDFAILPQVAEYIVDFMRRKPGIDSERQIMQPEFSLIVAAADVDMRGFIAFV